MKKKKLYTPKEVHELIESDSVAIIDVRDREMYEEGHIQGAVNIPEIFYYLAETTPDGLTAMHQKFREVFSQAGVSHDKTTIVYEESLDTWFGGSCRGYWILTYLGHQDTGILDGGLAAWTSTGNELSLEPVTRAINTLTPQPRPELIAKHDEVLAGINDETVILVDTLPESFYRGEMTIYPRAGHIPGAVNIDGLSLLDKKGHLLGQDELAARHPFDRDARIIPYCGGGIVASTEAFVLTRLGYNNVAVYMASLEEWTSNSDNPMELG